MAHKIAVATGYMLICRNRWVLPRLQSGLDVFEGPVLSKFEPHVLLDIGTLLWNIQCCPEFPVS